ncbi:MAG TPA: hypothetical protein VFC00_32520 [Micromonosporaceae bacterium]|nr:hypothetical protein [Micromonosporaceae bacterium]
MADSDLVAAELYDIWVAGKISMPQVAAVYAQGSRDMHNTSWHEDEAFNQPRLDIDLFPPSIEVVQDLGPVYPQWSTLRNTLQSILANTATSLTDAGAALCMIAQTYADGDSETSAALRSLIDERLADPGLDQPPGTIPDIKRPGDPHDTVTVHETIDIPLLPDIEFDYEEPQR